MMTRIAVLMTCYDRVQVTLKCLERLYAQPLPSGCTMDVWLVDDASPDGTGDKVREAFDTVHVIRSKGGLFWCKGMRLAWDSAVAYATSNDFAYDYYLWLNDDVMLVPDALGALLADAEALRGSRFVLVGTMSEDGLDGKLAYGCHHGAAVVPPNGAPQLVHGYSMSGNLVLVPKDVYEAVGPIYGGYHHAFGDSDYGFLIERNGIGMYCASKVLGVCPQVPERYIHLDGKTLFQRIKTLYEPKGFNLHDTFFFRYRNWGLVRAIASCCHVILRVIIFYKGY